MHDKLNEAPRVSTRAMSRDIARTLAQWTVDLRFEDLPGSAVSKLKLSVLDGFGCALYGSNLPWTHKAYNFAKSNSSGATASSIWGRDESATPTDAALVNGTAVQSLELDDRVGSGILHASSSVMPAVVALAESRGGSNGRDLITAMAVGWEIGTRISRAMTADMLLWGWHTPTINGTVAAAAASAKILGLDLEKTANAIALGVLQTSGLLVVQFGGEAKRFYAGIAARAGVTAALLAEQGVTAPARVFEGKEGGFGETYSQGKPYDLAEMTLDLGKDLAADDIIAKRHASVASAHPALDALITALEQDSTAVRAPISRIEIGLTQFAYSHCGWDYVPSDQISAQFSVQYNIAAYLLENEVSVQQYRNELLNDPRILKFVDRIHVHHDPELDGLGVHARNGAHVKIYFADGSTSSAARTTANVPSADEIEAKFAQLAESVLSPRGIAHAQQVIRNLENLDDLRLLNALFSSFEP